uniref:Zn(2)-C6 fungal-type domain-containing protein n=1 Tax=Mycena chlorophos TaxID=658473 RepID=A0ABQ0LNQ2_MYCCL|nr:predicted protein [Mycena chlorophos]
MSSSSDKPKKRAACDNCKKRRVLCLPSATGPCPRCVEKNVMCTTTPVPRGRPRKQPVMPKPTPETRMAVPQHPGPVFQSSANCPELTPEFVSHCFDAISFIPQYNHPLIQLTSIRNDVRTVSYQLQLLPPQSRVLALCIVAAASLASFHPSLLGDGPRPCAFDDHEFFATASSETLFSCGVRRQEACRALRNEALKAAWEAGTLLQPSNENAASCFLLDMMEQTEFSGPSRPWASAYVSHVRALAPHWHAVGFTAEDASQWAVYLMTEATASAVCRTPSLLTPHDQMMLSGPAPTTLDAYLASLEESSKNTNFSVLWTSLRPFLYHVTSLSRQLSETIAGDYPRLEPLSEGAVLKVLTALTVLQSALYLLTERLETALANTDSVPSHTALLGDGKDGADASLRNIAYGLVFGFAGIALPFYRELEHRASADVRAHVADGGGSRERMRLLRAQARDVCLDGAKELAKGLRRLPRIHYAPTPVQWRVITSWSEFCLEEVENHVLGKEVVSTETLTAFSDELKLLSYSLNGQSGPHVSIVERLNAHIYRQQPTRISSRNNSGSSIDTTPSPPQDLQQVFPEPVVAGVDFFVDPTVMLGHGGLHMTFGDMGMEALAYPIGELDLGQMPFAPWLTEPTC